MAEPGRQQALVDRRTGVRPDNRHRRRVDARKSTILHVTCHSVVNPLVHGVPFLGRLRKLDVKKTPFNIQMKKCLSFHSLEEEEEEEEEEFILQTCIQN